MFLCGRCSGQFWRAGPFPVYNTCSRPATTTAGTRLPAPGPALGAARRGGAITSRNHAADPHSDTVVPLLSAAAKVRNFATAPPRCCVCVARLFCPLSPGCGAWRARQPCPARDHVARGGCAAPRVGSAGSWPPFFLGYIQPPRCGQKPLLIFFSITLPTPWVSWVPLGTAPVFHTVLSLSARPTRIGAARPPGQLDT